MSWQLHLHAQKVWFFMGHMYSMIFCIGTDGFPEHHPPLKYVCSYLDGDPKSPLIQMDVAASEKPHRILKRVYSTVINAWENPHMGISLSGKNRILIGETLFPHMQRMYHGGDCQKRYDSICFGPSPPIHSSQGVSSLLLVWNVLVVPPQNVLHWNLLFKGIVNMSWQVPKQTYQMLFLYYVSIRIFINILN